MVRAHVCVHACMRTYAVYKIIFSVSENDAFLFFEQLHSVTDFNNFGYTTARRNLTQESYRFSHLTCKQLPRYLEKVYILI